MALTIHHGRDGVQQVGQMFFGALAAAGADGIKALQAAFKRVHRFADGRSIPAERSFGQALAPWPQGFDGLGVEATPGKSLQRRSRLDEQGLQRGGQSHRAPPYSGALVSSHILGGSTFTASLMSLVQAKDGVNAG
jgi:hypothetical protein